MGLLTISGCDFFKKKQSPGDLGKNYIENRFKGDEYDVSGLKYTVVEEAEGKAVVKISGTIAFNEELQLVKEDGIWKIATEAGKTAPETEKTH